jgi:copper chaperone NosL
MGSVLTSGCASDEPATVFYGDDACAHCSMIVSDERFAAQLKTETGKAHKFDAIECMAAYVQEQKEVNVAHLWISDFSNPGSWIPVEEAQFIQSPQIKSPMGLSLLGTVSPAQAQELIKEFGGQPMNWPQVKQIVDEAWSDQDAKSMQMHK